MTRQRLISPVLSLFVALSVLVISGDISNAQDQTKQNPTETTQKNNKKPGKQTSIEKQVTRPQNVAPLDPLANNAAQDPIPKAQPPVATTANLQSESTDLSGSYAGTFKCDNVGLTGDTTLTINGNQFSTADGKTGRIVAVTTQGYTAVALQVGEQASGTTPTIISLSARKHGDKLTLSPVDSAQQCSFTPTRTLASRRSRTIKQPTGSAEGTRVGNPAEVGPSPEDVNAPKTKSKKRKAPAASPASLPAAIPPAAAPLVPIPESPVPKQDPSPSPSPSPLPSPSPSPTVDPSPSPSPSPLPSPSPSPAPKKPRV